MSAIGPEQTSRKSLPMSGFRGKADMTIASVFFGARTKTRAAFWLSRVTASYSRFSIY